MNAVFEDGMQKVQAALRAYPWHERRAYADWLAQTYYYVCHSTRLLAAAAARFELDEAGNALHHRFAKHMAEEKKHELLVVHDLRALDFQVAAFSELPATTMFYESQYFKVEHRDPAALLGYILVLEATSVREGNWQLEQCTAAHGKGCVAFLQVHANEDPDHLEKAWRAIAAADAPRQALIEQNIRQTAYGYAAMLSELASR